METVLTVAIVLPVVAFVVVRFVVKSILARAITPASDLRRIRAAFEGVQGAAGPNKRVTNIVHSGGTIGTKYSEAQRLYDVTLARPDGGADHREVKIEVAFFGQGRMDADGRYL